MARAFSALADDHDSVSQAARMKVLARGFALQTQ
jgi:hypothetical protein